MVQHRKLKSQRDRTVSLAGSVASVDEKSLKMFQEQGPNLAPDIEAIINTYGASLRLYARTGLSGEDAVDEVLQQTWLALYLEGVKSGVVWLRSSTIYSWLRSVLHNRIYDYRKQRRVISLDVEEVMQEVEQRANPLEHPGIMSMRNEMALEMLDVILLTFTPGDVFVMLCFHYLEYSSKEIARMLCCSESTVKSQLRRTRKQLRKAFEDRGIQVRDIRQIGGLKERLDQVLAWLSLDAVPRDEWDNEIVQSVLQRKNAHPSWAFIAFDFLDIWDMDVAQRFQVCNSEVSILPIHEVVAPFHRRNKDKTLENY
jgi:RNA polymerase sigma factor (sigma-70 family)